MGKLTFKSGFGANDEKTLTKPFTYNGKTYNKITLKSGFGTSDGKVINLISNAYINKDWITSISKITLGQVRRIVINTKMKNMDFNQDICKELEKVGVTFDKGILWTPNNGHLVNPIQLDNPLIIDFINELTDIPAPPSGRHVQIQIRDSEDTNTGVYFSLDFSTYPQSFTAGHKYQFESGKDPVDLGEYETTTPSIKTITANMYSSAVISSHYNIAISFTDTSVWDALHPGAVTTTLLPEKIIFEVKEEIEVLPYVYFTLIDITTHKGFNVNYSGNGFTLKAGHKYQFENGKDPVDLGTY